MQYTVSSRGRPIGVTDLAFRPIMECSRFGWFYPNADGERVMETITAVTPAMRAYLARNERDTEGRSFVQPSLLGSTLFADLAEAFQRVEALELTLHAADGTLIPTESVGFQDTAALCGTQADWVDGAFDLEDDTSDISEAAFDLEDDAFDGEHAAFNVDAAPWSDAHDAIDREVDAAIEHDMRIIDEWMDRDRGWTPDDAQGAVLPRYQIHVLLASSRSSRRRRRR